MASTAGASIVDLPDEMLESIFSSLPVADLARCAAVCERWHRIVTGCPHLWKGKGKRFCSYRSPVVCAETRAVLHALPPFPEVDIHPGDSFVVSISYPRIWLAMIYIGLMRDCPRLRCEVLSTTVAIAGDILSSRKIIEFEGLQELRLNRTWTSSFWSPHDYPASYVIRTALYLCPNLRHLGVCTETLSAENLDTVERLGQLQTLEVSCSRLQKLLFLRHCSEALVELRLVDCSGLLSCELRELRQLRNLRKLVLRDCNYDERDLVVATVALFFLEWLELHSCRPVSDLSFLRYCGRLTGVRFTNSHFADPVVTDSQGNQQLHDLRLPIDTDQRLVFVDASRLTAEDLSAALSALEALGLPNHCLAYLSNLRHCTQLRNICLELVREGDDPELMHVRVFITLTGST